MAIVRVKLKNPSETVLFQSLVGTYSHLGWIRTEGVEDNIMTIYTTDDLVEELRKVLRRLQAEVEFEIES